MDGNFVSIMTWYDNEWGSTRMAYYVAMAKLISFAASSRKRAAFIRTLAQQTNRQMSRSRWRAGRDDLR